MVRLRPDVALLQLPVALLHDKQKFTVFHIAYMTISPSAIT